MRRCAFIGCFASAAFGAIGGLTGVMRSEYPIAPWGHALLFAGMLGGDELLAGLVFGIVTLAVRRLWSGRRPPHDRVKHDNGG